MMALTAVPNPPTTPRRVKVYELRNNDWFDRGTGYCTGHVLNDEPHIQVKSEDETDRLLLNTKIIKYDGYQKQQETLIVWTEPQGTDMALSFQEAEGCAAIWEFVSHVQSHLLSISGADEILSDDATEAAVTTMVQLPMPELGNLEDIESIIRQASSTPGGRDALGKYILNNDYIIKLIPFLEIAEDLESITHLHRLCNIMKMIILLNDTLLVEKIVTDEMVLGVVGILEYDPDFPTHKANHRQFLGDKSKFKEVVPIRDPEVEKKIHQTFRLQYLKDVVLARILDDPTFSVLNSLIFYNQFDILHHLQNNQVFMKELFGVFHTPTVDLAKKKLAILFIQNCCLIAKGIQAQARAQLYTNLIQNGLFSVIDYALVEDDPGVRIAGTDILVAMIDHDSAMMRTFIYRQINEKQKPLTFTLIELLLGEQDLGVKAQIADAIRVLLDHSQTQAVDVVGKGGEITPRIHTRPLQVDNETEGFLRNFYEESAKKLFAPLRDLQGKESLVALPIAQVSLYSHLVETLCFFVRQHAYRSKYFLLTEHLPSRVAQLLGSPEKHLKLTALKFFRTCIGLQDEFYIRHMVKFKLFEPIIDLVLETMPRDNLLNSACLEFFEFIKRESLKQIITHIVECYREKLESITYVQTFADLINKYDQLHDPARSSQYQESIAQQRQVNGNRRWQGVRDMDAAEEAYFNTSDDEDKDEENAPPSRPVKILNGSPLLKPLVDYGDEDDEIDLAANLRPMKARSPTKQLEELSTLETTSPIPTITTSPKVTTPPAGKREQEQSPVPPPKRRKERDDDEDDEDELGRLSRSNSGKRKTPGGAGNKGGLVRKRSFGLFGNSGVGQGPGKKIAISLAPKLTNSPPTQEKSMIVTTTTTITSSDEAEKEN